MKPLVTLGQSSPLGATVTDGGANFSLFSRSATGVEPGQIYGYRIEGPLDPARGMRLDRNKVLLDPYARGVVVPKNYSRRAVEGEGDNVATAMNSVVVYPHRYDWEGDAPCGTMAFSRFCLQKVVTA